MPQHTTVNLSRMDRRFGDPRDAARGQKTTWLEEGNLLERMPTEAELKAQQDATTAAGEVAATGAVQNTVTVVDNSNKSSTNITTPRTVRPDALQAGAGVAANRRVNEKGQVKDLPPSRDSYLQLSLIPLQPTSRSRTLHPPPQTERH